MTERFTLNGDDGLLNGLYNVMRDGFPLGSTEVVDLLNEMATKCSKLEKENEQLKIQNEMLSDELEQAKAVINNCWSEYLKKKGDDGK